VGSKADAFQTHQASSHDIYPRYLKNKYYLAELQKMRLAGVKEDINDIEVIDKVISGGKEEQHKTPSAGKKKKKKSEIVEEEKFFFPKVWTEDEVVQFTTPKGKKKVVDSDEEQFISNINESIASDSMDEDETYKLSKWASAT